MPVRVRPITLWRTEVDNLPGALARTLEPLAAARADLKVVMGYRLPGDPARAAFEVAPVTGPRATSAAQMAGLHGAAVSALQVDGENRAGLGHAIARALADGEVNIDFLVGQVSGSRYTVVIGFDNREVADRAVPLIKRAAAAPRKPARPKARRKGRARAKMGRKATRKR